MTAPLSPFAAFRSRDFRLLASARLFTSTASQMMSVSIGYQVYALTRRPLDLGYVGLAQFVPVAGLALLSGQVVDRFDRRRVYVACQLGFAVCALSLFALSRVDRPSLPAIYAVLVGLGTVRAFAAPAGGALVPSLVPKEHFANAASWQSLLWQVATIGGPSVGGLLYGLSGPSTVYLTSFAAFCAGSGLLLAMRVRTGPSEQRPPSLATALEGLRFVWSEKLLLGSISLDLFAVFLGGAVALLPVYATDVLHVGPEGLGLLRAAPAVGAGLMALRLAFRPLGRNAGAKMLASVALFGVATVIFGLSRHFALSLIALATLGAADMVSVVVRQTIEQAATPHAMRGRVGAVNYVFIGASNELGELESGVAAAWIGAVPAVIAGGIGTVLVVALWSVLFPELRRVDRLSRVRARGEEPEGSTA
jgi:MFS family permease